MMSPEIHDVTQNLQANLQTMPAAMSATVSQGLQGTLPATVRTEVSRVTADAFRAAFTQSIVPAFEQAMQVMFKQVRMRFTCMHACSVCTALWCCEMHEFACMKYMHACRLTKQ
jgi:cellobiose-specific phosphotransferase system component IIC